jgi:hypothetical protein
MQETKGGIAVQRVATFHTTHSVLKAERVLVNNGLPVDSIAVPRHISSDCGIGIRFNRDDEKKVVSILASVNIEISGVYDEKRHHRNM